jgi:hypothetical protein
MPAPLNHFIMHRILNPLVLTVTWVLVSYLASFSQTITLSKDSLIYRYIYRDTIVYRYDTVRIVRYIYADTVWTSSTQPGPSNQAAKKKGWYNPNSWGIGPMAGAYYSPYHGFDFNIGFGIQYYLFAVPSFRNPHMGSRRKGKR